jgi:hypothetical protein
VTDIDASAHLFLAQLREETEVLREGARAARQERDEADARLADCEAKLAHSAEALRALLVFTGEDPEPAENNAAGAQGPTDQDGTEASSIEEAILQALRGGVSLAPLEITRRVEALGVSQSAGSVRARLSKLLKRGVVQRDGKSSYRIADVEATRG